ncbi:hypothetical protein JXA88_17440 [Candidatus Fermentibacteria bacterium]|nr:hypothetical protein [Candidatus Fermentibacteria bacterium]
MNVRHLAFLVWLSLLLVPTADTEEPGLRVEGGISALKPLGSVGDDVEVGGADFTVGAGGYAYVNYRLETSFSVGVRCSWHGLGVSGNGGKPYENASFMSILLASTRVFNPDEDIRPFAVGAMGLSWMRWRYAEPHPLAEDPTIVLDTDRRRATTFLLGGGAEIQVGDYWEFLPALHVLLHGWSNHTQWVTQYDDEEKERPATPRTVSLEITVGVARRF